MRILLVVVGLLLSAVAAHAERVIPSGKQLILFNATSVNPDCSALGNVEVRVAQGPEHGKVSIRRTRVFPNYAAVNLRSACNARRVAEVVRGLPQQVVLVTHHLDLLADFDRVLVFDRSWLVHDGTPADAIAHYLRLMDDDR